MTESLNPKFQAPEDVVVEEIELSRSYIKRIPASVIRQFEVSWGEKDKGWKIKFIGGAVLMLVITGAGAEHFRKNPESEDYQQE